MRGPLRWAQNRGAQNRGEAPSPSFASLTRPLPARRGEVKCNRVLATPARPSFAKAKVTKSQAHEKPRASGAPGGAGVVGHATRTDVATRPRFGRGARHRRSACANRLLRARCASRRSTTIAVPRRGCRPAAARAPLPLRRPVSSTGVLRVSGKIRFLTRNIDLLSSIYSYHIEIATRLNHRPRRLSDQ